MYPGPWHVPTALQWGPETPCVGKTIHGSGGELKGREWTRSLHRWAELSVPAPAPAILLSFLWALPIPRVFFILLCKELGVGELYLVSPILCQVVMKSPPHPGGSQGP